jgi:spore coat protein U-like protein
VYDVARANSASANHAVYGRIPAGQNATIGAYSDTVAVTILY